MPCRQILELPWKEETFLVLQSLLERQVSRLPWGRVDKEVLQCCGWVCSSWVSDPFSDGGASRMTALRQGAHDSGRVQGLERPVAES